MEGGDRAANGTTSGGKGKVFVIGGAIVIALAAIVIVSGNFWPPKHNEDVAGTIGVAQRYRTEQVKTGDVELQGLDIQKFLQTDTFHRLISDPATAKALADPDFAKLVGNPDTAKFLGNPDTARFLGNPDTAKFLGSPDTAKFLGNPDTAKFLGNPDTAKFFAKNPDDAAKVFSNTELAKVITTNVDFAKYVSAPEFSKALQGSEN